VKRAEKDKYMTKKDYILIADAIKLTFEQIKSDKINPTLTADEAVQYLIAQLIPRFAKDNPRFDAQRFAKYINA